MSRLIGVEFGFKKVPVDDGAVGVLRRFFGKRPDDFQFQIDITIITSVDRNAVSDPFFQLIQSALADDHPIPKLFHFFDRFDQWPCLFIG